MFARSNSLWAPAGISAGSQVTGLRDAAGRPVSPLHAIRLLLRHLASGFSRLMFAPRAAVPFDPLQAGLRIGRVRRVSYCGAPGCAVAIRWMDSAELGSVWLPQVSVKPGQVIAVVGHFGDPGLSSAAAYYVDRVERVLPRYPVLGR